MIGAALSLAADWDDAEAVGGPIPLDLRIEVETLRETDIAGWIAFRSRLEHLRAQRAEIDAMIDMAIDRAIGSGPQTIADDGEPSRPIDVPPVWVRLVVLAAGSSLLWMLWHWIATGERIG